MQIFWYIVSLLRTVLGLLGMIVWMIGYLPVALIKGHSNDLALALREHYLKYAAFPIFGLSVEVEGQPIEEPALYVANHRSFTDPVIICRYLKAFVVAKAEVAKYPIISQGAKLTGVMFVKRGDKTSGNTVRQGIIDTIKSGYSVLIYPEGTVGTKRHTLPFKGGAFASAVRNNIPIVPIAVEYKSEKDLWVVPNFIKQFMIMYAKPITYAKLSFGSSIEGSNIDQVIEDSKAWIDGKLLEMQEGWTEIEF